VSRHEAAQGPEGLTPVGDQKIPPQELPIRSNIHEPTADGRADNGNRLP